MRNELLNKKTGIITKTEHNKDALDGNQLATKIRYQPYQQLDEERQFQKGVLEDQGIEVEHTISAKAKMYLSNLNHKIV